MRIHALAIRIMRQFMNDKRSIALMMFAPMLILSLVFLVFNSNTYQPKIGIIDAPPTFKNELQDLGAIVIDYNITNAKQALDDAEINAMITFNNSIPTVTLEGSDPAANKSVTLLLQKLMQKMNQNSSQIQPDIQYLYGSENMAAFDNFGPVLIGLFAFLFVFLISGVTFLRERTGGTLERLLTTPLRRSEIVLGYILGFGLFTMIQAALIAWFSVKVLGMMMMGSFWYVILITLLLAMVALTMGTFLSAFANNEFQMIQFIPLVIVPQIFFSGLFNMETMSEWLRWLSVIMPLSYGADALREVMIRGKGWSDIAIDVYILFGISVFFMTANVLALKRHRKI